MISNILNKLALKMDRFNYQKVIITVDSIEYDISDIIVNITHNVLNIK